MMVGTRRLYYMPISHQHPGHTRGTTVQASVLSISKKVGERSHSRHGEERGDWFVRSVDRVTLSLQVDKNRVVGVQDPNRFEYIFSDAIVNFRSKHCCHIRRQSPSILNIIIVTIIIVIITIITVIATNLIIMQFAKNPDIV